MRAFAGPDTVCVSVYVSVCVCVCVCCSQPCMCQWKKGKNESEVQRGEEALGTNEQLVSVFRLQAICRVLSGLARELHGVSVVHQHNST